MDVKKVFGTNVTLKGIKCYIWEYVYNIMFYKFYDVCMYLFDSIVIR